MSLRIGSLPGVPEEVPEGGDIIYVDDEIEEGVVSSSHAAANVDEDDPDDPFASFITAVETEAARSATSSQFSGLQQQHQHQNHGEKDSNNTQTQPSSELLKPLLHNDRTRIRAITKTIQFLIDGTLSGKEAFKCSSELYLCFYMLRNCQRSAAMQTLAHLEEIAQGIIALISEDASASLQDTTGILRALEFLPSLVNTMQHIENQFVGERTFSDNIMKLLFEIEWRPKLILGFLNLFSDIELSKDEERSIAFSQQLEDKVISCSIQVSDCANAVRLLMDLAEKFSIVNYVNIIRTLLMKMPTEARSDVYFFIEWELKHSHQLIKLFLSAIKDDYAKHSKKRLNNVADVTDNTHQSDIMLLMLAATNELFREEVFVVLNQVVIYISEIEARFNISPATLPGSASSATASSSSAAKKQTTYLQSLFFRICEVDSVAQIVMELCTYFINSTIGYIKKLGESVLVHLFHVSENSRADIFGIAFNAVAEEQVMFIKMIYCRVLEKTAQRNIVALMQHVSKIQEWFGYLGTFPLAISKRLLHAFMGLMRLSAPFKDFIHVLLRKYLNTKNIDNRKLAIYGLCQMLAEGVVQDEKSQADIIMILKPAFNFAIDVRSILYYEIINFLRKCSLKPRAHRMLFEVIHSRVSKYMQPVHVPFPKKGVRPSDASSATPHRLNILLCFEDLGEIGEAREKEPFAELVQCLLLLYTNKGTDIDEKITRTFLDLFHQLSDVDVLFSSILRDENGEFGRRPTESKEQDRKRAQRTVGKECSPFLVTQTMRMIFLLPLYEVLIEFVMFAPGLDSERESSTKYASLQKALELFDIYTTLSRMHSRSIPKAKRTANSSVMFVQEAGAGKHLSPGTTLYILELIIAYLKKRCGVRRRPGGSLTVFDAVLSEKDAKLTKTLSLAALVQVLSIAYIQLGTQDFQDVLMKALPNYTSGLDDAEQFNHRTEALAENRRDESYYHSGKSTIDSNNNSSSSSSNSVLKRRTRTTDNPGLQQQYLMCDYVVYILSCIFDILELTKTPVCVENDDDGSAEQNSDDALTIYGTRPKNRSNIPEQMSSSATTTELVEKFRQHSLVKTSSIQIGKDRLVEELRMLCYALTERIVTTAQTPPAGEITSDQDDERPGSVLLSIALAVSSSPPLISASVPPNLCDPKDFSLYLCQQLLAEIQEGTSSAAGSLTACLSLAGSLAAINAEDFNQSEQSDRVYDVTYRILTELKSTQPSVVRELIKFMLMHTTPKKGLDRADKIINSCLKYHKGKISRKDPSLAMCLNASCFTHSAHMVLIFYENTITPLLEKGDKTKVLAQDKDHLLKRLIDTLSTIYSMCIHYPTLNGKIHSIITATCRHITSDLALAKQIIRAETTALKKTKGGADDRTKRRRLRELYDGLQDRIAECDALGRLLALFIRSNAQGKTKSAKGRSQNVLPKKLQQLTQLTEKFHLGIKHLASTYENLRKTAKLILDRNRSSSSSSDEDEDEDETGSSILKPIAALDKLATSEIEALVSDSGEEDESPEHTGADEYSDGNDNDVVARKPKASATGTTAAATKSRVTRKRPRLRSSNAFIDEHLGEISDDDMDTYADLEDFIVTNDDDIE